MLPTVAMPLLEAVAMACIDLKASCVTKNPKAQQQQHCKRYPLLPSSTAARQYLHSCGTRRAATSGVGLEGGEDDLVVLIKVSGGLNGRRRCHCGMDAVGEGLGSPYGCGAREGAAPGNDAVCGRELVLGRKVGHEFVNVANALVGLQQAQVL